MNVKELEGKLEKERTQLLDEIRDATKDGDAPSAEEKQVLDRMEKALGEYHGQISELIKDSESDEIKELRGKVEKLEREPEGEPKGIGEPGEPDGFRTKEGRIKSYRNFHEGESNLFLDMFNAAKGKDFEAASRIQKFNELIQSERRLKTWATGDLETVSLVTPDIQGALPFLAAAAKTVNLCRELRTSTTSVEFPVFTSGLDVEHVPEGDPKPESDPDFELVVARVYTIAGLTSVPNSLLEDYPAARGWISSELGRATGVQEDLDVLVGDGVGEPTGILNHSDITGRAVGGATGRDKIEAIFRAIQDVRINGLTEPSDIVMNPAVWTDIVLAFESNIGYLYGPPGAGDSAPKNEPQQTLLGLPVTLDAYVPNTYGSSTNASPVIVGDFMDAVVLRRSPFRIDVDTSLGFKVNVTWFRGEERMGFLVVRPASFKIVTGIVPTP